MRTINENNGHDEILKYRHCVLRDFFQEHKGSCSNSYVKSYVPIASYVVKTESKAAIYHIETIDNIVGT